MSVQHQQDFRVHGVTSAEDYAWMHARAIVRVADLYRAQWDEIAAQAGWTVFDTDTDLVPLLAAVADYESNFRLIVHRNTGVQQYAPAPPGEKADYGPMQVRAPTPRATACGVKTREDLRKMVKDIDYSYEVSACVLAKHLEYYLPLYQTERYARFRGKKRDVQTREFLGLQGPRKDLPEARLARELVVLERYNWGDSALYANRQHGSYARNVLSKFEYFRSSSPPK